jgi:hypothetical protein
MPVTLEDKLVVAISSRALFNLEEENKIFEAGDNEGYMKLQLDRIDVPAAPGIAYSLIRKLLRFNDDGVQRVEVVILSRNDPVSGMRIFRSSAAADIKLQRGVFTQGRPPFGYLRPLRAHLFLSVNAQDVREALNAGFPAARVLVESVKASDAWPNEVRIAFDGDRGPGRIPGARAQQGRPAAARRPVQAAALRAASAADGRQCADAHSHRTGYRTQRARARTRDPHADEVEHPRRRGDVPRRPAQG